MFMQQSPSKLKNIGKDVGGAVKDFKKSIRDEDNALSEPKTIDHDEVKKPSETSFKS